MSLCPDMDTATWLMSDNTDTKQPILIKSHKFNKSLLQPQQLCHVIEINSNFSKWLNIIREWVFSWISTGKPLTTLELSSSLTFITVNITVITINVMFLPWSLDRLIKCTTCSQVTRVLYHLFTSNTCFVAILGEDSRLTWAKRGTCRPELYNFTTM
jgi:hypothetical protein